MKRVILVLSLLLMSLLIMHPLSAADDAKGDTAKEKALIKQAALDYFEGWYEGSAERMTKALHHELAKRRPFTFKPTGKTVLQYSPYSAMIEYARSGMGKKAAKENLNITVKVFDVYKDIASARVSGVDFYDFIHLAKVNGEWKIINVLWQRAKERKPRPKIESKK